MILYFADRAMNILGFVTTHKISAISIVDDYRTEETDTGVSTLEVTVGYSKASKSKAEAMSETGNYILFSDDDMKKFYTIIDEEIDSEKKEIQIYAEDAGLDLINEIVGPFEAKKAHDPEWYINKYIKDSGFEIGLNEFPESKKTLSWDGESTVTERLASIATKFGGFEISYSFDIKRMKVVHKYVNIHEKRGKDIGKALRIGREIKTIRTKKTVANLATALECEGGTPDGKDEPITLEGMDYDDGEFYTSGKKLCSRSALEKWSRYAWEERDDKGDGHIVQRYSYDTTNRETLCKHAIAELKKIYDVEINYEIDINYLPSNIEIGDRVNIVDNEGELYVSARILEFKKSVTRGEYTATLGEYLIRDKGIDDYLNNLANKVKKENQNTTLYTWIAYADDAEGNGISLEPDGKAYMGVIENRTTEEPDISDPSIYKWSKIQGEDGIHEVSSVDQYYLSTSSEECIGDEWLEEIPDWETGKYIWKRRKIIWSDGSVTYTDPVLEKSMNSANEVANDAKNLANTAQAVADEAMASVSQIDKEVADVKSDASAIREEMETSITAVKEEMAADYTKKTETETVEANLKAEISKSADEIQTTMESDYTKKTELTEASENLQTQITQNAEQINLRATKTEVEEKLSGYSTKTETESSINAMADSINLNVSSKFTELENTIDSLNASLELKVDRDKMISEINASADVITLNGNRFVVNSDCFNLTEDGTLTAVNGVFTNAAVEGKLTAEIEKSDYITKKGTVEVGVVGIRIYDGDPINYSWVGLPGLSASAGGVAGASVVISQHDICFRNMDTDASVTSSVTISNSDTPYVGIYGEDWDLYLGEVIKLNNSTETCFSVSATGAIKGHSISPVETGLYACGLDDARWSTVYTGNIDASAKATLAGQVWMNGVADENFQTIQTYAANMYIGASGRVWKTSNTSSKTKKHDIFPLEDEDISAERLLDVQVVQAKYNEGVLSESDQRYMKNMPMFIIEDLYDKYPIAVDIPDGDVKNASWNERFLLPPMLLLIQEQHKDINRLLSSENDMSARMDALSYMLEQAFSDIVNLKKENETLKQALA